MNNIEGLFSAMKISSSGLAAQRRRMNNIAENLANIHTTNTPEGGPYKRKISRFATLFDNRNQVEGEHAQTRLELAKSKYGHMEGEYSDTNLDTFAGVQMQTVKDDSPPVLVYDPDHPDADEFGYVEMPNVNVVTEMVDMIAASRAYEANIAAIKTTREMANKALEI